MLNEIDALPSEAELMARVTVATSCLDVAQRAGKLGLKAQHYLVLAALVETAAVVEGDPNTAMAIWQVAQRTALSPSQVKAAMAHLTAHGYIARKQSARTAGVVAVTVVSRASYELFGIAGGAAIGGSDLPPEFGPLLVGEAEQTIQAIADAYHAGAMPAAEVSAGFRGGHHAWCQVEFLLQARVETEVIEYGQRAVAEAAAAAGVHMLDLPNGQLMTFQEPDRGMKGSQRYAQAKFARDVLERVGQRAPAALSADSARILAAEIMYARTCGFVHRHDYEHAMRIVASLIVRGTWTAPLGMSAEWYQVSNQCVAVSAGKPTHKH